MRKRARLSDASFNSEDSDYELKDIGISRRSQKNKGLSKAQYKNKRRNIACSGRSELSGANTPRTASGDTSTGIPHARATHVLHSATSIQTALLRWYSGVHASRGMPWRKPYNPAQGTDERAQRAYEVLYSVSRPLGNELKLY